MVKNKNRCNAIPSLVMSESEFKKIQKKPFLERNKIMQERARRCQGLKVK